MDIPYQDIRRLLNIRLKQIEQDALEFVDINTEYMKIKEINLLIADILISQKRPSEDVPAFQMINPEEETEAEA